jgi:hypothetical protein
MQASLFRVPLFRLLAAPLLLACGASAQAAVVNLRVTVENLAPAGGIAFAPLHVGFGQGIFDAFNTGAAAGAPIVSVAEGGSGSAWQPAFAAADPTATRGVIGGLLLSGASASRDFTVDSALNPFFTFAAMVVPSNDQFIGNDNPMAFRVLDAAGQLLLQTINQSARDIWDAGSEVTDPDAAAFVGNNDLRTAQNGVVSFNFSELSAYNGRTTGAGYVFNNNLTASTAIYRIGFEVLSTQVPEPGSAALALAALLGMAGVARSRRHATAMTPTRAA